MQTLKEEIDALVRDLTKTMPIPVAKSYARKRIMEVLEAQKQKMVEMLPKERDINGHNVNSKDQKIKNRVAWNACLAEIKKRWEEI